MAQVSLSEGARLTGRSKGTLSKALTTGKLSYVEKSDAGYLIDTSELFRVFPPKRQETVAEVRSETPKETPETIALRVEVEMLRERVADLASDRDAWRDQAQRLLLEGPAQPSETVSPKRGWGFWKRG